jgi:hypothetical protein
MKSLTDRFRRWYEYERDCNAKSLDMLASVPADWRSAAEFAQLVAGLGGRAVDTDYIFWCKLVPVDQD